MVLLFLLFLLFLLILIIVLILIINKNRTHIPENYKLMHSLFKNKKAEQNYINIDIEYEPKLTNKTIYRLWCSKDYNVNCSGRLGSNRALNITKNSNSNWKNVIYDDNDKKNFLYDIFGKDSDITKAYFRLNEVYPAARADLIRLLLLYVYGGVYLDSKSCLIKGPLPDIPDDKQMWVTNWIGSYPQNHLFDSGEYINWFIYSKKGAPILKDIINDIVDNILNFNEYDYLSKLTLNETKTKSIILSTTGPIAFTTALLKSQHKDAVEINNNIFKYLKYECNKTGIISGHYSTLKEPLIMGINMNFNNSNKIFLTYYDLNKIPKYVLDNLYLNCKGYDIELFDDNKCIIFLNKYYGETAVNIFKNFKMGAHKADFFRYCILYLFGGIYFDIKTEFIKKFNIIFVFYIFIFNINMINAFFNYWIIF